ncbi:Ig-like domain-containing protein [Acinetobacter towneri]|uniref:Ig-like domain-containing protein n=1 Tax=Acinetobacter towneri TaxID=202956 RepID=UPI002934499E|nr:Ig-like domain-containing protein [Acinetobacter towneri]WOE28734.1 Ig-like domain-containing protein [Acinetobacter towneri]
MNTSVKIISVDGDVWRFSKTNKKIILKKGAKLQTKDVLHLSEESNVVLQLSNGRVVEIHGKDLTNNGGNFSLSSLLGESNSDIDKIVNFAKSFQQMNDTEQQNDVVRLDDGRVFKKEGKDYVEIAGESFEGDPDVTQGGHRFVQLTRAGETSVADGIKPLMLNRVLDNIPPLGIEYPILSSVIKPFEHGLGGGSWTPLSPFAPTPNTPPKAPVFVDPSNPGTPVASYTFNYDENSSDADVIGTVKATDVDSSTVTYSISSGNGNNWFEINANTGEISLTAAGVAAAANDYEALANIHNLVVTATDGTNSTNINVTLNEQDINDNAPVFEDPSNPGTPVASYTFNYDENSSDADVIGTVKATDVDSSTVTYSISSGNGNNWFEINANTGEISLTAAGVAAAANDYEALANIHNLVVTATDGTNSTNINVTLNEQDINDNAPVANDDTATVDEGDTVVITVKGNDTDAEDGTPAGVVTIVGAPANGTVTVNANGTVSYVHDGSETSSDSFTYTVIDSNGVVSNTATVNITVNPVNDAPVANDDTATVDEGDTVVITVKGNDTDAEDGTPAGVVTIVGAPANGTVTVNANGTVSYVHDGSETSSDSFTYTVTDSNGVVSNTATVNITINGTDDLPVAVADVNSINEDAVSVSGNVRTNDTLGDGTAAEHVVSLNGNAVGSYGTLLLNADGSYTYSLNNTNPLVQQLAPGDTLTETYSYTLTDKDGDTSVATLTITITGTNDVPVIAGDDTGAVTEDASTPNLTDTGTLTIVDADGGQAVFQTTGITSSAGALGSLSITSAGA